MADTRHDWLTELARLSPTVAALNLTAECADQAYWDAAKNHVINEDAYNLSGSADHNAAIVRWVSGISAEGATPVQLTKLLSDLTSRNTYGTFAELAAYGLLVDNAVPFEIQVPVAGRDILNPKGSHIDGCLKIDSDVLFDVKAFGLHEHLSNRLQMKLAKTFPSNFVAVEGSGDVGVIELNALLDRDFQALVTELRTQSYSRRGGLEISLRPAKPVQISKKLCDPYELAKNNAEYAFKYSKQFARRKSFMLIFVFHPWMG
jgi:hypothetical protein